MSGGPSRVAPKEYDSIGEVCELVGLKPHVLRYWESQFPALSPAKNRSGNRVYLRREIDLILLVKELLHEERYTIEGAKRKLNQLRRSGELTTATAAAVDREVLTEVRKDLQRLHKLLSLESDRR